MKTNQHRITSEHYIILCCPGRGVDGGGGGTL